MDPVVRRRQLIRTGASLVAVICTWMFIRFRSRSNSRVGIFYGPMLARDRERTNNLRFIYHSSDRRCVELLRMKRAPFFQLCDLFRNLKLLKDSIHTSIEEQVAMFLLVVGHNERFRVLTPIFRRFLETISRYFHEVLYAVGELRSEMIVPPSSAVHPKILNSRGRYPFFKDCVVAIDGTHIQARVSAKQKTAFMGRKHCITQNVLAAVDWDLRFTYVLADWERSAHDARILADALARDDGLRLPQGKISLVDAGYAVRPGFLPPYRGTRYHLKEFGVRRPQNPRELFNLRHSSLRTSIERGFGALKGRFMILDNKPFHPYKTQVKLVIACCTLHNWILRFSHEDLCMITLDPEHYNGHVKDYPKDAEFLNVSILNYNYMQIVFGSGIATGKFVIGSNDAALGQPPAGESIYLDDILDGVNPVAGNKRAANKVGSSSTKAQIIMEEETKDKKRKKTLTEEDTNLLTGLTESVKELGTSIKEGNNNEAAPGIYEAMMEVPGFARSDLMVCLNYLMKEKGSALVFVGMKLEDKVLWLMHHLAEVRAKMAFQ